MRTFGPRFIPFVLFTVFLLPACAEKERSQGMVGSSGGTAEILVVADKALWDGPAGDAIREVLATPVSGMPQAEPRFDLIQIAPDVFDDTYRLHHNILVVQTDGSLDSAMVETKPDYWASPQRLIRLRAPDAKRMAEAIRIRGENVKELFTASEYLRLQKLFGELQDVKLSNRLKKTTGLGLIIPGGFYAAKLTENFAWLRKETKDFSQGLLIYFTPYEDTTYFHQKLLLNRRDQMCMIYVPGEREGSYMRTAGSIAPESRRMQFKGRFAVETRGLWDVAGDFMGGPFVNYAILDEKNNRIISMDAYVYFPNNDKRDLMLQLEAMMHTLELP
ncbi:MAG TPA: DUF4837 family protein [Bacteroidales bacterium]|nr:DUF4837 family protein [Bacteroidales bacterium]HRZ76211.1 DUF4837 family protein [Bacteroidales bacterium]